MSNPLPLPPLVCGIDDGYVRPLRALMRSIARAHSGAIGELRLIVLDQGLAAGSREAIEHDAQVLGLATQLRPAPVPDPNYPVSDWVSSAVYTRLSIPEVIPEEPRVLYLDADTMVLGDLRPLLRRPLLGSPVGAVLDAQNPAIGYGIALPGWDRLGIPMGREYFNSGVMLIDLARCRKLRTFEKAHQFLAEHPGKVRFWDQDALNVAADNNWLRLEPRWNTFALSPLASQPGFIHYAEAFTPLEQLLADEETAAVIHFAGPDKPWNDGYPEGRLKALYQGFLSEMEGRGSRADLLP
ncbi:glycosyltransferase family 8 protein [Kitasatospora azatica]|uniref:glycosyltransferase family 8 protein n=1 Tax=Kitasatospora azatica TaxID=58347 RepID=UPI00056535B8|nr:glycosyltransferase family 8 protein [Kitasatospora azatica]